MEVLLKGVFAFFGCDFVAGRLAGTHGAASFGLMRGINTRHPWKNYQEDVVYSDQARASKYRIVFQSPAGSE